MRNTPFRFYKQNQYEGGVATPAIVHWPSGLETEPGAVVHDPAHLVDVLPTLAELAGAPLPEEWPGRDLTPVSGVSLAPILAGRRPAPRPPIYYLFGTDRGVRDGDWKLVSFRSHPWELYNLATDRTELNDLAARNPEVRDRLVEALARPRERRGSRPRPEPRAGLRRGTTQGTPRVDGLLRHEQGGDEKGEEKGGPMNRTTLLLASLWTLCGAAQAADLPTAAARPNILLILPDQMRGSAMGCMGNPDVRTPNLDRLAREGVLFRRTYANVPVCCPARAILLTGTYPHVNGMVANDLRLRESEVTIAEILRDAGYRTGFVGKWHLDGGPRDPGFVPPGPRRQGFEFWAAYECSHRHFLPSYFRDTPDEIRIPKFEPEASCDFAVEFLKSQPDKKPFFLTVQMGPPHDRYGAPEGYMKQYDPEALTMRANWRPNSEVRPAAPASRRACDARGCPPPSTCRPAARRKSPPITPRSRPSTTRSVACCGRSRRPARATTP